LIKGYFTGSLNGEIGGPYSSKPTMADPKVIINASRNFQLKKALLNSSFSIYLPPYSLFGGERLIKLSYGVSGLK
jgi:hypothetical protein